MRICPRCMLPENTVFPMMYLMRLSGSHPYIYDGEFSEICEIPNGFPFH